MNPHYRISVSSMVVKKKFPLGDPIWKQFNSSFVNTEMETGEIIQAVYDGRPVTTWHANGWRTGKNYLCGQHLGLDFDHGTTLTQLFADPFILHYCAFIYTTLSHTEENPRLRAFFVLDEPIMQARNYGLAASALLWLFGEADRQCRDAVRFWYGSPGCQFEYLDNILPLEKVRRLIENYQETGQHERKKADRSTYLPPPSQQEVMEALRCIPPWGIEYDEWLSVLMAIHNQFGEEGYGLAQAWGDGKGDEIERKWKGFKLEGNTAGMITIGTLFAIAKRFGWRKG